jgi:hypothetical protein
MKTSFHGKVRGWIGLMACLLRSNLLFAQTASVPVQTSGSSDTLQTFQQEWRALAHQWRALVSQGATRQQLKTWQLQNAPQFAAQQQLAQALSLPSALNPARVSQWVNIPASASPTLKDFLTARATLANARAQIHNQLFQSLPANPTQQQVSNMQQQEMQAFQQQEAGDIQLQVQRAQTLAAESASQAVRVPGAPMLPPNAPPQMQAFLTARNALARAHAQLQNQYLTATPAVRQAAMLQWQQQNAAALQQLSELAQNLSNSTETDSTAKQEGISQ